MPKGPARLAALGLLSLCALSSCHDDRPADKPGPRTYQLTSVTDLPMSSPREGVIKDVAYMILDYHFNDSAATANPQAFDSGHGSYPGHNGRRYKMLFPRSAMRAELNRLRDSLLATGPADFSDTLLVLKGPGGKSPDGVTPPSTKTRIR